jgi:hypothetical protein
MASEMDSNEATTTSTRAPHAERGSARSYRMPAFFSEVSIVTAQRMRTRHSQLV